MKLGVAAVALIAFLWPELIRDASAFGLHVMKCGELSDGQLCIVLALSLFFFYRFYTSRQNKAKSKNPTMQIYFCLPCMEQPEGNELCFLSHPQSDQRLQCSMYGELQMVSGWEGGEVWRFVRHSGNHHNIFRITSGTHKEKTLCANKQGKIGTTEKAEDHGTLWRITPHRRKHGLWIQSVEYGYCLAFHESQLRLVKSQKDR
jgi:hypothetical protein